VFAAAVVLLFLATTLVIVAPDAEFRRFVSEAELASYLERPVPRRPDPSVAPPCTLPPALWPVWCLFTYVGATGLIGGGGSTSEPSPVAFSETNSQVEGVQEPDIVKTDGERLYVARSSGVVILDAYPPESAAAVSWIHESSPIGLLLHGDRLVLLSAERTRSEAPTTRVRVYDVADARAPRLTQTTEIAGSYLGARMIGDRLYVLAGTELRVLEKGFSKTVPLPELSRDGQQLAVRPQDIGHFEDEAPTRTLLTVLVQDVRRPTRWSREHILLGGAQDIYVSRENLYVRGGKAGGQDTALHRFEFVGVRVDYRATGIVRGRVLNQFALDEYEGHLRVATTGDRGGASVYVLNPRLDVVGSVERIAPGETMHSARFSGDRAYLVTFKKVDPFFVLDVSDPRAPRVLGELKVPGYSDYLHPYDENYIIGLGKDGYDMGGFAWFQGVKLSLFDVRDMKEPKEVASVVIGDRGTESEALRDHHAFLFDRARNLLVIPIRLAEVPEGSPPSTYGRVTWVGAHVFHVDATGFALRGEIDHGAPGKGALGERIRRSLFIEDGLYTVSDGLVKVNDLGTLAERKAVPLR
jgi:uncharacterized secreted protein with C-terminal beta-propeller domain